MSFSSELRQELCRRIDRAVHCRIAMLAGIIALDGKLKDMDGELCLSIRMEKDEVVETAEKLFQILFGIGLDSLEVVPRSQEGARVRIRDKEQLERIFETCKLSVVGEPDDTDASGSQNPAGRSRLPKLRPGMDARLDVDDIVGDAAERLTSEVLFWQRDRCRIRIHSISWRSLRTGMRSRGRSLPPCQGTVWKDMSRNEDTVRWSISRTRTGSPRPWVRWEPPVP